MSEFQNGANVDMRTDEERKSDYLFKEVVAAAAPVSWVAKDPASRRSFPTFNQDGSGSCVAQTEAKELGIMRFLKDGVYVHFSATDIYQRRVNKPEAGMQAIDARKIAAEGVTLEVLTPSQNMTDMQMDTATVETYKRKVGEVFAVPNYVELPVMDIETIASVLQQTGKGVMVWFYFDIDEWAREKPIVKNSGLTIPTGNRHSVAAVDYFLEDGKKCIKIEDSAHFGGIAERTITEDFFKVRNWYSSYLTSFAFDGAAQKPQHTFLTDLEYGMQSDEVKALQDCLKWEKTFPSDRDSTGYFGAVTKKAVMDFQTKHGISPVGRVGPLTRAKLNQLFAQ